MIASNGRQEKYTQNLCRNNGEETPRSGRENIKTYSMLKNDSSMILKGFIWLKI
jgi:hypothetical protein